MLDIKASLEFVELRGNLKGIPIKRLIELLSKFPDDYMVFAALDGVYPGSVLSITEPERSKDDGKWVIWGTIDLNEETLVDEREDV